MIDVIIPVTALIPNSVGERLRTLELAIDKFYLPQKCNVIVVEQSLDGQFYYLDRLKQPVKKVRLNYPVFNKQWCINAGVKLGKTDVFCVADSDMYAFDHYFGSCLEYMQRNGLTWCMGWKQILYTNQEEKEGVINGKVPIVEGNRWKTPRYGGPEGGFVFFTKQIWQQIGWGNEFFQDLGGMDNELTIRCVSVSKKYCCFPQQVYHLWHQRINKSSLPHRNNNRNMYFQTKRSPGAVNNWLRKHKQGIMDGPLCSRANWLGGLK